MKTIVKLAWRSIWRQKRRTLITLASLGLGLSLAIVFIALGEGAYDHFIDQAVRMQAGHVTLEHTGYRKTPSVDLYLNKIDRLRARAEKIPGVESTKLLVLGQGMARSANASVGVGLVGVEPSKEAAASSLPQMIVAGRYLEDGDKAVVVLGQVLADRLKVKPGRKLVLTTNDASGALIDAFCRVKGVFKSGSDEMDGALVQAPIGFLRKVFGQPPDSAMQLGVILEDGTATEKMTGIIRAQLADKDTAVEPWQKIMPEMAAFIRMDKANNVIMQAILLFLISFTVLNTLLMSVLERKREFAMLLALGTTPSQIRGQLLAEAVLLGALGGLVGAVIGWLGSWYFTVYGIDFSAFMPEGMTISGFFISPVFHAKVSWPLIGGLAGLMFLVTLLLSLLVQGRAVKVDVTETLRG